MIKQSKRRYYFIFLIIVILLGLMVYSNTFSVPFYFDDNFTIVDNLHIRNIDINAIKSLWCFDPSRFITHYSFALNYHFSELSVHGYHVVNLTLHLLMSAGIFIFLHILLLRKKGGLGPASELKRIVVLAALIFVCHPIQTQAVTYISQRSTLLASCCYLLVHILYMLYRENNDMRFYRAAFFVMFLGLFTKPIIITLPVTLFLYEVFFCDFSAKKDKKIFSGLLPFLALAFIVPLLLILWKYKILDFYRLQELTRETVQISRKDYLLTQFNVVMTYLRLLFVPIHQSLDYDYPIARSFFSFPTWISFSVICCLFVSAVKLFKKEKVISFGMFWMFITLSLESSIFPISDVIFEHRLYLPMVGFVIIIASLISKLFRNIYSYTAAACIVVAVCSILSYQRNHEWNDLTRFHEQMVVQSPEKSRLRNNLGIIYMHAGKYEKAKEQFLQAIQFEPDDPKAYINLSNIYIREQNISKAKAMLEKAIELRPLFAIPHYNLGNLYFTFDKKNIKLAAEYFTKALKIHPNYTPAIVGLGKIRLEHFDFVRAKFYFDAALRIDPSDHGSYVGLGDLHRFTNNPQGAIYYYYEALKRNPNLPVVRNNLGNLLAITGDSQKAVAEYKQAIAFDPQYINAYINLVKVLTEQGDEPQAREWQAKLDKLYAEQNYWGG